MAKVQYEKLSTGEPVKSVAAAEEPRHFHSHFLNCFGNCDSVGWGSCCLVYWCPCIAFGMNIAKVTGKTGRAITYALLMLVAIVGIRGGDAVLKYNKIINPCFDDENAWDTPCTEADLEEYYRTTVRCSVVVLLAFAGLVTLGIANRRYTRRALNLKYHVDGGCAECCDDTCAWCCFPMGLCQETRTMFYNRVENGEWKGPMTMENSIV
ncbi:hypothetical protein BSKO_12268 [Bryopsis sp. KO-2023]|nr:hypothetical protein BSKO_12268 [Bryopsis sp. KO-2023]